MTSAEELAAHYCAALATPTVVATAESSAASAAVAQTWIAGIAALLTLIAIVVAIWTALSQAGREQSLRDRRRNALGKPIFNEMRQAVVLSIQLRDAIEVSKKEEQSDTPSENFMKHMLNVLENYTQDAVDQGVSFLESFTQDEADALCQCAQVIRSAHRFARGNRHTALEKETVRKALATNAAGFLKDLEAFHSHGCLVFQQHNPGSLFSIQLAQSIADTRPMSVAAANALSDNAVMPPTGPVPQVSPATVQTQAPQSPSKTAPTPAAGPAPAVVHSPAASAPPSGDPIRSRSPEERTP